MLAGCTVGPDFTQPKPDIPGRFAEQPDANPSAVTYDTWWQLLHDPMLDRLITEALTGSPDLEAANARVREARAERAFAAAEDLPVVNADASALRQHGSGNVPTGTPPGGRGRNIGSNLWLTGFDAGWEIDVFGGIRREVESAEAS